MMHEYTANFHQHTTASDGAGTHLDVIRAGAEAGLGVMVFTDHNTVVSGVEGWYDNLLVLMGVEVNDISIEPEMNHYLCLGVDSDLQALAANPQAVIDKVNELGGQGFVAHPFEHPAPAFGYGVIPWLDWEVEGYTGLEIWNYMSEVKSLLTGRAKAIHLAYNPDYYISGPFPQTLARWDSLTGCGQKVVAIGNSDAHGQTYHMGPLRRTIFPYAYLFGAVRTHLLMAEALAKDLATAKQQVLNALGTGHCFVAYDTIGDTTGFRFGASVPEGQILFSSATSQDEVMQGDEVSLGGLKLIQLYATTPSRCEIRLLKDGQVITTVRGQRLVHTATEPGVYRVECYKVHKTRWRGWIFSNPIYVRN